MKYSFILTVLNEEKLIEKLLNQISAGGLKNKYDYEIIVSDGGSGDRTVPISLLYADKITIHTSEERQNISIGKNAGASCAKGDILVFLAGDVLFKDFPLFMELMEKAFADKRNAAFTCDVKIPPEEEIFSDKMFLGFYNRYFRFLNLIGVGMGRGECHAVRREVFESINGNNTRLASGEDFDLFMRVRRKGKVIHSTGAVVYESPRRYRQKGHVTVFFSWLLNSIWVLFIGRSPSRVWKEIR